VGQWTDFAVKFDAEIVILKVGLAPLSETALFCHLQQNLSYRCVVLFFQWEGIELSTRNCKEGGMNRPTPIFMPMGILQIICSIRMSIYTYIPSCDVMLNSILTYLIKT